MVEIAKIVHSTRLYTTGKMCNLIFKNAHPPDSCFCVFFISGLNVFGFLVRFIHIHVLFHFLVFLRNNIWESGKRIFYFLCHCDVDNLVLPSTVVVVCCKDFFILSLSECRRPSLTVYYSCCVR